jgi:putative DNA primase/helicase
MDRRLELALQVAAQGIKILPQTEERKPLVKWDQATTEPDQIRKWYQQHNTNFAAITGSESGIVVLDVDVKDGRGGKESLEKFRKEIGNPHTLIVRTPSGGSHIYYAHPGQPVKNKFELDGFPGIEIKGDRSMITIPGSYRDGKEYRIAEGSLTYLEPFPRKLIELSHKKHYAGKEKNSIVSSTLPMEIPKGKRNATLTSIAGKFYQSGIDQYKWLFPLLRYINTLAAKPPLPEEEVQRIAESILGYPRNEKPDYLGDGMTDLGNAQRLYNQFGQDIKYCFAFRKWFVWDGTVWNEDRTGEIQRMAVETVKSIYREASMIDDEKARKALASWAKNSESKIRRDQMITSTQYMVAITPEEFDTHLTLINLKNGVYDLDNDEVLEPKRELLFTKQTNAAFEPDAECPRWEQFLNEVFEGDEDLIHFMQKALGYTLSGLTTEQCIFILYGIGQNGKSTLLETVGKILGDYFASTPTDALMTKRNSGGINNEIARLRGIRYTTAIETAENRRMAEPLIKVLTGGDTITARFLWAEFFDFTPHFKIFLAVNHKPKITGTDVGIWRRIRLIPFNVQFPEGNRDPHLKEKLIAEGPGILKWMMIGYSMWKAEGLQPPDAVREATAEYKTEQDIFLQFLQEKLKRDPDAVIPGKEIYAAYKAWAEAEGERVQSRKWTSARLEEHGFEKIRKREGVSWRGVCVG